MERKPSPSNNLDLFLDSKFFERGQVFEFSEVLSSLEWHRGACGGSQGNKPFGKVGLLRCCRCPWREIPIGLLEEEQGSSYLPWRDRVLGEMEPLGEADKYPLDVLERKFLGESFPQEWFLPRKCASVSSSEDASRGKSAPSTLVRCRER